jgi:hypothetical protein
MAAPLSAGVSGNRGFATTNAGALYVSPDGVPPTEAKIAARAAAPLQ